MKCSADQQPNASICDSFTVITSLTTAAATAATISGGETTTAPTSNMRQQTVIPESCSSSASEASAATTPAVGTAITTVYIGSGSNVTSTPTVLSTFSPLPSSNCPTMDTAATALKHTTDQGYYGSSDYSENNSFARQSNYSSCHAVPDAYVRHHQQQQQQQKRVNMGTVVMSKSTATTATVASSSGVGPQATSSSSFASSSVMSSPSSSTDSYSSDFLHQSASSASSKPAVTNLYPAVYQTAFQVKNVPSTEQQQQSPADVKIYLEKFERIYNSSESATHQPNTITNTSNSTPLNTFNKQRNSMTTYSYV